MTGKRPEELEGLVELPLFARRAWRWFLSLHSKRVVEQSVHPISYSDMLSFFVLHQKNPFEFEINLMNRFDRIVIGISRSNQKKELDKINKNKK